MAGGNDLVEVAFVGDEPQALMIQGLLKEQGIPSLKQQVTPSGPMLGYGLLNPAGGSQRVIVNAGQAEQARRLLAETLVEDEDLVPEPVNAEYLAEAEGRKVRNYGLIGAYAWAFFWSFLGLALLVGIYFLLRVV
jgi:hypothetical protein